MTELLWCRFRLVNLFRVLGLGARLERDGGGS